MANATILHPTDGSKEALKALGYAADLAKARDARLLLVHVQRVHGSERVPPDLVEFQRIEHVRMTEADVLRSTADYIIAEAAKAARDKGAEDVETLVVEGDPARRIVETAKEKGADTIVMGSRGLGDLQGLLLGSVSHKVTHLAPCTCIIVR
ncbi:universal stress protein [Afifella pfennigii]|uniref:universal stress protein n=1 Tax=Afifella pfennigii TaxID=209897 RepID=UPI00047AEFC5|nr:universal stress protein [Afifella pfennigii]